MLHICVLLLQLSQPVDTGMSCVRRPLREALGHDQRWTIPLIHGFWQQRSLALFGRTLTLTLLARRCYSTRTLTS